MQSNLISRLISRMTWNVPKQSRYLHDIKIGDNVTVKRTITSEDVKKFAELTGDTNPVHFKPNKPIVHGAFLNGLVSSVIGTKLPGPCLVCDQEIRFPKPCYVGEEVSVYVEVTNIRKVVNVKYHVYVLDVGGKKSVLKGTAQLMLQKEE